MMSGLTTKPSKNSPGSSMASNYLRADVGEIDTSAPFQSVKAAVSRFGEVVSPMTSAPVTKRSKAEERVLEKETLHCMIVRELECYKEQLKSAEAESVQAQRDLERANRTLQQLTNKLETLSESRRASIEATEAAKTRLKELEEQRTVRSQRGNDAWNVDIEGERDAYKACTSELVVVKQEVANLRHDFEAALPEKLLVFQKMEDAQHMAQVNQENQNHLLQEVTTLREMLDQVKLASLQAQEEHSRIIEEEKSCLLARRAAKEETEKEIQRLREEYKPKEVLEQKLEETMDAVKILQDQLNEIQASDLSSIKAMASELNGARKKLDEVVAEENSLRISVEEIKQQLEEVQKERAESEQKTLEMKEKVKEVQAELTQKKTELEAALFNCPSASCDKLSAEAERARQETGEYNKSTELLMQEAEAAKLQTKEVEENLKIALEEVEEAKAAQKLAEEQMRNYARGEAGDSKDSGSIAKIRLPVEEFESMKKKIKDLTNQADDKVVTAMAQVDDITSTEKEVTQKLEEVLEENEALQLQIQNALKRAQMAEAAKTLVEIELQKRHNKQNEASSDS